MSGRRSTSTGRPGRSFTVDERARVPFALVGVVLVVASATFVVAVQPDREPADPAVDVVVSQATGETRTAIRRAVRTASANAARNPVLTRANTSVGRVLNASTPFEDALRVRIYLRVRERLAEMGTRREGVQASVSLPPTPNATALRRAKDRVHIARTGENGTALRVHVENVTIRASRAGETVGRRTISPNVTVRTPVLALHDRVTRFQNRLDRGIGRPGLLQGFTARLYALTWTRGAAFYGGATIENVLGTRHVAFATNSALLAEQRAVFGRSDAAGRRAQRRATAAVAISDVFAPQSPDDAWVTRLLHGDPPGQSIPSQLASLSGRQSAPRPGDEMTVGVNETADHAFAALSDRENLSAVLQDVYSANVTLLAERARIGGGTYPDWPDQPEESGDWELDEEYTTFEFEVTDGSEGTPSPPPGAHVFATYTKRVTQTITRVREWETDNETTDTREQSTIEYRVTFGPMGYHALTDHAPRQGIASVHERGGPFSGPNLESIPERAIQRLVEDRGGAAAVARRVANGTANTSNVTIQGDLPNGTDLRWWVLNDLVDLRNRVRNVTTQVERGRLATFQAMPAGDLENRLANNRSQLLDAPDTYSSVAAKARVAARGAYIEAVRDRLLAQRDTHRQRSGNIGDVFDRIGGGSLSMLRNGLANVTGLGRSGPATEAASGDSNGTLRITSIDGEPPYLTTAQVGDEYVPSLSRTEQIHPLATRNVNAFTTPFGDVVDALLGGLLGQQVPLRSAASTLHGAQALGDSANETLSRRRARLADAVGESVDRLREDARWTLREFDIGESRADRRAIVAAGLSPWETNATAALAFTNGSAARSIAGVAAARASRNTTAAAVLQSRMQFVIEHRLDDKSARISKELVNRTHAELRAFARLNADRIAEEGIRRGASRLMNRLNRSFNRVQTGLPVAPFGNWLFTANLWYVEARGAYDRFAVRARRGTPTQPGSGIRYVRDGETVRIDFDGDGTGERFGQSNRIAFSLRMVVPFAVPPGMPGVGDTNGNWDERSVGWADWTVEDAGRVPPSWE